MSARPVQAPLPLPISFGSKVPSRSFGAPGRGRRPRGAQPLRGRPVARVARPLPGAVSEGEGPVGGAVRRRVGEVSGEAVRVRADAVVFRIAS